MSVVTKALILTALTLLGWLSVVRYQERSAEGPCRVTYVYDGDTVALTCGADMEMTARIVGLDAPETKEPRCPEELAHGTLATERLRALVAGGEVAYYPRGEDRYDRLLIRLYVDGQDVAKRLVREGLAVTYRGGARPDWCARLGAA